MPRLLKGAMDLVRYRPMARRAGLVSDKRQLPGRAVNGRLLNPWILSRDFKHRS